MQETKFNQITIFINLFLINISINIVMVFLSLLLRISLFGGTFFV